MAEHDDGGDEERRIARARESVAHSFDELIGRLERESVEPEGPAEPSRPAGEIAAESRAAPEPRSQLGAGSGPGGSGAGPGGGGAGGVAAWIRSRVEAAERRLELQARAIEAALGEEAIAARRAAEQVERSRRSLDSATQAALGEVAAAADLAGQRFADAAEERAALALGDAEARARTALEGSRERISGQLSEVASRRAGVEVQSLLRAARSDLAVDVESSISTAVGAAREQLSRSSAVAVAEARRSLEHLARTASASEAEAALERAEARLAERFATLQSTQQEGLDARMSSIAEELEGRVEQRLEAEVGVIERLVAERIAAAEGHLRERTEAARGELDDQADRLREEVAALRGELAKKRVRRERTRIEAALQARHAELVGSLGSEGEALLDRLREAASQATGRAEEAIEVRAEAARAGLDAAGSGLRASAEAELSERAGAEVAAQLGERAGALDERLAALLATGSASLEARVLRLSEQAVARLAAVEHAQEREERVRERTSAAERRSEQRVRAAEQRLIQVLGQLEALRGRGD